MNNSSKVSCVIPAFNEEARIAKVLTAVTQSKVIDEILVINDGSTDNTELVARSFSGVKVIGLPRNKGKAAAVSEGVRQSLSPNIVLLDSDLHNLTSKNVTDLAQAALLNPNRWVFGTANDPIGLQRHFGFDLLTGERAFPKKDFLEIRSLENQGYALEVLMNDYIRQNQREIAIVPMSNVSYKSKSEKFGIVRGFIEEIKMTVHIYKTLGIPRTVRMFNWYFRESRKLQSKM